MVAICVRVKGQETKQKKEQRGGILRVKENKMQKKKIQKMCVTEATVKRKRDNKRVRTVMREKVKHWGKKNVSAKNTHKGCLFLFGYSLSP